MRANRRPRSVPLALALALALAVASSCGNPAAPESTPTESPTPTATSEAEAAPVLESLPTLRTGTLEPVALPSITGTLTATRVADAEYFEIELTTPRPDLDGIGAAFVDGALAYPRLSGDRVHVLVRRPKGATAAMAGSLLVLDSEGSRAQWFQAPFTVSGPAKKDDADLPRRFADAMAAELRGGDDWTGSDATSPFHQFAAGRVHAALLGGASGGGVGVEAGARPTRTDLAELMHTTTAATSLQEALQHDRGLGIATAQGPRSIPLAELKAPPLVDHPFEQMRAKLPDPSGGVAEPLAAATPAEFWYVRFSDVRQMLRVLDEADAWMTPVAQAFDERPMVRDLAARYQRQLGLRTTGLARALGHTVVARLAIVGSDPYLREGSDVTFVFELHDDALFDAEIDRHMGTWKAEVAGVERRELGHAGRVVTVHTDPHGLVRQHRAKIGKLAIVSNSAAACTRVLDAIEGRRPRLSDQPDLGYMLARDPGEHDAFVFLGDRFIGEAVAPRQKIQQARRQQALAELLAPGYAALLHGWLVGAPPKDAAAMVASRVLREGELRHSGGEEVAFTVGDGARSSWGSPESLVPLIDLPEVERVSEVEREAYDRFSRSYQDYWRQFIDPVAVRLDFEDTPEGERATLDVRVLPLISGTEYDDLMDVVGEQRIEVPALAEGMQGVWAVGRDTNLRRELDRLASSLTGNADIGIGWLGDWVLFGALDRRGLVEAVSWIDDRAQLPRPPRERDAEEIEQWKTAARLPIYAAADVDNVAALIATLAGMRTALNDLVPGTVTWGEHSRHGEVPIVRIGVSSDAPDPTVRALADAFGIYYAQFGDNIVMALDPEVLATVIDGMRAASRPQGLEKEGTQFVVEARLHDGRAGWTALLWLLQGQARANLPAARLVAEAILRGDPSTQTDPAKFRALALATFGGVPVTPEGRADFSLGPLGVRDPLHGSELAPTFVELPVPGDTPIGELMHRLSRVRAEVSFDREPGDLEPPARSLHTRFELVLEPAAEP